MYIPASHAETDRDRIHEFIEGHSFATLVSSHPAGMIASHVPLLLDRDAEPETILFGHMARANPQWRDIAGDVLAIFSGPHVYVSPAWYQSPGTVPTWNYVAVHAYGTMEIVEEDDILLDILNRSVLTYEGAGPDAWKFDPTAPYVAALLRGIVGFRITVTRLEGKWKLSQNHPKERRARVIAALDERSDDHAREIADLMRAGQAQP